MSVKIIEQDVKNKIQILYPNLHFELINYTSSKYPFQIKCLNCGKIHNFSELYSAIGRVNLCKCTKDFSSTREKVEYLLKYYNFTLVNWTGAAQKVIIRCNNCNVEFSRLPLEVLKNPSYCTECNNSSTKRLSIKDVQDKINNKFPNKDYQLLQYTGWKDKSLIKHLSCGLIFKQHIGHFLDGCGCPKCNKKRSQGEKTIKSWLEKNNINFVPQYRIDIGNKRSYLDFMLTDFNIAIEYNGEQHYNSNNYYNRKQGFEQQQERDERKRNWCKEHLIKLIEIPYWNLSIIDDILNSEFNDYLVRE